MRFVWKILGMVGRAMGFAALLGAGYALVRGGLLRARGEKPDWKREGILLLLVLYLAALLPHGVVELPALLLSLAVGLYICGQLSRRCRKDQSARSLWSCMTLASQMLLWVLVPLLLIASFVEAYVTPAVAALFL